MRADRGGVLFLCPELVWGYWEATLTAWRASDPSFRVLTYRLVRDSGVQVPLWISELPGGRGTSGYYPTALEFIRTPILRVLVHFLRQRPRSVVCYGFSFWTLLTAMLRRIGLVPEMIVLWEGSTPGVDLLNDRLRQALRCWMARTADRTFSQTRAGRSYLENLGVHAEKLWWLLPDMNQVSRRSPAEDRLGCIKFVFVGTIESRKGVDILLRVFEGLPGDWELHLFGGEVPAARGGVTVPSHPRIFRHGRLSHLQLLRQLAGFDVFVFPSREDTWGVAPLEGAAAGLTVIASDQTGSREAGEGWIVLPLDESAWRKAIEAQLSRGSGLAVSGRLDLAPPAPPWRLRA